MTTTREPPRGAIELRTSDVLAPRLAVAVSFMWSQRAVRSHLAAMLFFVIPYAAVLVWVAAFLGRSHGVGVGTAGPILGVLLGVAGGIGSLVGGMLADRMAPHGQDRVAVFIGGSYLACAPCLLVALAAPTPALSFAALAMWAFTSGVGTGPQFAILQSLVGLRMRARATAILGMILNGGYALGPQIVGNLSDALASQFAADSLRVALAVIATSYVISFAFCLVTARRVVSDTKRALTY